jgi:hypothetical protein
LTFRGKRSHNRRMARVSRRLAALLALASFVAPSALACLIALHLAEGHREHAGTRSLAAAFHGHGHEHGTPDHEHPSLTERPVTVPQASAAIVGFAIAADRGLDEPGWDGFAPHAVARRCLGPPGPPGPFSILRI